MTIEFSYTNHVRRLQSSLLPIADGTDWARSFFDDALPRTLSELGPQSAYPDWVPGKLFISCAARPFFFHGVYNSGDGMNFNSLIAGIFSPELMIEAGKIFPALIRRYGFAPGVMNPNFKDDRALSLDYSGTTWGPCCYWDHFAWSYDRDFLADTADASSIWARWWLANRDANRDGWLEGGVNACTASSPEFRKENAERHPEIARRCPAYWDYVGGHNPNSPAMNMMICEIPWDDWPVYVRGRNHGLRFDPKTRAATVHYIETQLYISLLCKFTADAFDRLGRSDDAGFFREHARRLAQLVADHCWDETTGFYYDRDIAPAGQRTLVKHLGAFVAMLMGLPSAKQARRLVEHLTNPDEFWTPYPAPTISKDSLDYAPTHYWSGRAWPPTNFFVLRALLNYGFFDVADEYLRRWMRHVQTCVDRPVQDASLDQFDGISLDARRIHLPGIQWIVPENWNPETGEVIGSGGVTWGGLWLPAIIFRHFWPVWHDRVLIRPGGSFKFTWSDRWDIEIDDRTAVVNGRRYRLADSATYILDPTNGQLQPLGPGRADPVTFDYRTTK